MDMEAFERGQYLTDRVVPMLPNDYQTEVYRCICRTININSTNGN